MIFRNFLKSVAGVSIAWLGVRALADIDQNQLPLQVPFGSANHRTPPPPPRPEPISITTLPLPPAVSSTTPGSCTVDINPHGTGCILQIGGLQQAGGFLPDGVHVTARVNFTGSDPSSVYDGDQLIILKTDGGLFSNGDAWKCLTCGALAGHDSIGELDYPQPFRDGKRVLAGANIIDCGDHEIANDACTPEVVKVYPLHWITTEDGAGRSGNMRELRLHPDNVHIGFNAFTSQAGRLSQYAYFARLDFDPSPTKGLPLRPRYDLTNVTILFDDASELAPITSHGDQLHINESAIVIGELRGFSGTGTEVTYIGYPAESSNIDVFAADLLTGKVRRLTSHPEYCDPVDISPDDQWSVVMDTRGSQRQMFMAGMRHIPPLTDLISSTVTSSTRNNGARRFFQPYLIDKYGDRGAYFGQRINEDGDGTEGSINDREWNGRADPKWSLDGTKIVYWQALTVSPACGGDNPLPCQNSTEPGGRTERIMLAHLTSRTPLELQDIEPVSDTIPWGIRYVPGSPAPVRKYPKEGEYTLDGKASGSARIFIKENDIKSAIVSIAVEYTDYSDDDLHFLNGMENFTTENPSLTLNRISWFSDLEQTGEVHASKKTSSEGFHLEIEVMTNFFNANGTLTTTVDGEVYLQPSNGT